MVTCRWGKRLHQAWAVSRIYRRCLFRPVTRASHSRKPGVGTTMRGDNPSHNPSRSASATKLRCIRIPRDNLTWRRRLYRSLAHRTQQGSRNRSRLDRNSTCRDDESRPRGQARCASTLECRCNRVAVLRAEKNVWTARGEHTRTARKARSPMRSVRTTRPNLGL